MSLSAGFCLPSKPKPIYHRLEAGKTLLIGYPGKEFAGTLFLISYIDRHAVRCLRLNFQSSWKLSNVILKKLEKPINPELDRPVLIGAISDEEQPLYLLT